MDILKRWVWPVLAGFIVASVIMLLFEWINHFVFPKPGGLDLMDPAAVQAFTASLPWTAYILVFVGWAVGTFVGGCTSAWLAGEKDGEIEFGATGVLAALLVVAGVADMTTLGFPAVPTVLGILILAGFPFIGRLVFIIFQKKPASIVANG